MKSFFELVLHRKGTWKGRKGNKQSFQDNANEVLVSWSPSNKTIDLQGSSDIIEKIDKTLTDLIQQVKTSEPLINKQTEYTKDEMDAIWAETKELYSRTQTNNIQEQWAKLKSKMYRVTQRKYSCLIKRKIHNKRGILKTKYVCTTNELT